MSNKLLQTYKNGDYAVELYSDGTKIREGEGVVEFPESIDLKITNYCDGSCPYCHESSTEKGKHASLEDILKTLNHLPPGVEIAIGGGNPLAYPFLRNLLSFLKERGFLSNITINEKHCSDENLKFLKNMQKENKIYGIGVSLSIPSFSQIIEEFNLENIVYHCILGEMSPFDVCRIGKPCKVLLLGDKRYGRGENYFKNDFTKIGRWKYFLPGLLCREDILLSFDNLAIEQLELQKILPEKVWEENYMGDDGQFTMYVDCVKMEYAISSTSERKKLNERSAREVFGDWKNDKI